MRASTLKSAKITQHTEKDMTSQESDKAPSMLQQNLFKEEHARDAPDVAR